MGYPRVGSSLRFLGLLALGHVQVFPTPARAVTATFGCERSASARTRRLIRSVLLGARVPQHGSPCRSGADLRATCGAGSGVQPGLLALQSAYAGLGDTATATAVTRRLVAFLPGHLACARDDARLLDAGYGNFSWARIDPDLQCMRDAPRFVPAMTGQ
jgi:hypothetical protein